MKNHKGKTVQDRIIESITYMKSVGDNRLQQDLRIKLLGAIDFAVEFKMITYQEWEKYVGMLFSIK